MSNFWRRFEGQTLKGRYRLLAYIGSGAMGGVFRAYDPQLKREVAVKIVYTAHLPEPQAERSRRRFAREAEAAAGIASPYVVTVHDSGSDGELDYLVMELLDGNNLADWLMRNSSPPLSLRLELIHEAALGLTAGHAAGIVHRDLKPSNLFVVSTAEGGVGLKLVDFGIAKHVNAPESDGRITVTDEFIGTRLYASPEQLQRKAALTPASDVFSLGILAYILVTGAHPFTDEDRTRLLNGSQVHVPSPQRYAPELPDALCDLILRALQASPALRPQTAGEFANALAAVMHSSTARTATAPAVGEDVFGERTAEQWPTRGSLRQGLTGRPSRIPRPGQWFSAWPTPVKRGVAATLVLGVAVGSAVTILRPDDAGAGITEAPAPMDLVQKRLAARAANDAGLDYLEVPDVEGAVTKFQIAVDLDPDQQEYPDNLAYALRRAGRLNESVTLLESVVTRFPERVSAHFNLAESYLAVGDTGRAIAHLRHYIAMADSTRAESARRKLRLLEQR